MTYKPYFFCRFFEWFCKEIEVILHPETQSYTQSYTRNTL